MEYDVFISHASEDKDAVARPLAERLNQLGLRVWLDEVELTLGDSLRRNIDNGLSKSKFGVVILSKAFFRKEWTQKELDGLVAKEDGKSKVILPIWHNVDVDDVKKFSITLSDKLGVQTTQGLGFVAERILQAINREGSKYTNQNFDDLTLIDEKNKSASFHSFQNLMISMLEGIQVNADAESPENIIGIGTGFADLDLLLSGLLPATVSILASRPSMGKTDFLLNISSNIVIDQKLPVLFFSLDNTASEITNRITSSLSDIDTRRLPLGQLRDEEWPRLTEAIEKCRDIQLLIDDKSNQKIDEILERAKQAVTVCGSIGLIVIDGVQLIHGAYVEQQQGISSELLTKVKSLARELNCPIIISYQLDRRVELRSDKRPLLADLDDFTGLDRYVDTIIFLYRDDLYRREDSKRNLAELIVAKQKKGLPATIVLEYAIHTGKFFTITGYK